MQASQFIFNLGVWDYLIIAVYFIIILAVGFKVAVNKSKTSESKEDFILAGRKLTLPIFVATLVATWYGNIIGVGEFVFNDGIVAWVCFSFTYYVSAFLFAIFISKRIRDRKAVTIPEQIASRFGVSAGLISSIIVLIITIPAVYVLILGLLVQMFTGWSLEISIILSTILSFTYIIKGGFKSDVYTNTVQFILMYIGFAVLFAFAVFSFGGFGEMFSKLPEKHLELIGNYNIQFIIVWFIIALQTFVDPGFHQRCAAAKSSKTARNGILISILCWGVFDFLTLFTALYSRAYFPEIDGIQAYTVMSNIILPQAWKGLFLVSLIATVMSTLDSYAFISGATIGNDIMSKSKMFSKYSAGFLTKIGMIITGVFSIILAILVPSAVELIYKTASVAVPGLFFPLLISYFDKYKLSGRNAVLIMLSSSSISFIWMLIKDYSLYESWKFLYFVSEIEQMFPGILLSLFLGVLLTKKGKENVDCI